MRVLPIEDLFVTATQNPRCFLHSLPNKDASDMYHASGTSYMYMLTSEWMNEWMREDYLNLLEEDLIYEDPKNHLALCFFIMPQVTYILHHRESRIFLQGAMKTLSITNVGIHSPAERLHQMYDIRVHKRKSHSRPKLAERTWCRGC